MNMRIDGGFSQSYVRLEENGLEKRYTFDEFFGGGSSGGGGGGLGGDWMGGGMGGGDPREQLKDFFNETTALINPITSDASWLISEQKYKEFLGNETVKEVKISGKWPGDVTSLPSTGGGLPQIVEDIVTPLPVDTTLNPKLVTGGGLLPVDDVVTPMPTDTSPFNLKNAKTAFFQITADGKYAGADVMKKFIAANLPSADLNGLNALATAMGFEGKAGLGGGRPVDTMLNHPVIGKALSEMKEFTADAIYSVFEKNYDISPTSVSPAVFKNYTDFLEAAYNAVPLTKVSFPEPPIVISDPVPPVIQTPVVNSLPLNKAMTESDFKINIRYFGITKAREAGATVEVRADGGMSGVLTPSQMDKFAQGFGFKDLAEMKTHPNLRDLLSQAQADGGGTNYNVNSLINGSMSNKGLIETYYNAADGTDSNGKVELTTAKKDSFMGLIGTGGIKNPKDPIITLPYEPIISLPGNATAGSLEKLTAKMADLGFKLVDDPTLYGIEKGSNQAVYVNKEGLAYSATPMGPKSLTGETEYKMVAVKLAEVQTPPIAIIHGSPTGIKAADDASFKTSVKQYVVAELDKLGIKVTFDVTGVTRHTIPASQMDDFAKSFGFADMAAMEKNPAMAKLLVAARVEAGASSSEKYAYNIDILMNGKGDVKGMAALLLQAAGSDRQLSADDMKAFVADTGGIIQTPPIFQTDEVLSGDINGGSKAELTYKIASLIKDALGGSNLNVDQLAAFMKRLSPNFTNLDEVLKHPDLKKLISDAKIAGSSPVQYDAAKLAGGLAVLLAEAAQPGDPVTLTADERKTFFTKTSGVNETPPIIELPSLKTLIFKDKDVDTQINNWIKEQKYTVVSNPEAYGIKDGRNVFMFNDKAYVAVKTPGLNGTVNVEFKEVTLVNTTPPIIVQPSIKQPPVQPVETVKLTPLQQAQWNMYAGILRRQKIEVPANSTPEQLKALLAGLGTQWSSNGGLIVKK